MKRAALAVVSTLAGLVVLLGFKTVPVATSAGPATTSPSAASSTASGSSTSTGPSTASGSGSQPGPASGSATPSGAAQTVTGRSISTRYGDVQVQVTVVDATITDVTPLTLPGGNPRDVQINAAAVPVLRQEAIAAQSADVQMVSGATYTSQGYVASLQSALDRVPALSDGQG